MLDIQRRMLEKGLANAEDFDYSGALKSKITFRALVLPWEISERHRVFTDDEGKQQIHTYWLIKDKYGASFSSKDEKFIEKVRDYLCISLCEITGSIRIVRGGTYMNAEGCNPFDIEKYVQEKENDKINKGMANERWRDFQGETDGPEEGSQPDNERNSL